MENPAHGETFTEALKAVTISCKLRLLLARANVERAKEGNQPLSLRRLAQESGVSLSVLAALHRGQSRRIDYTTIDQLLNYFNRYFAVTVSDLLLWEADRQADHQKAMPVSLNSAHGHSS